MKRVLLILIGLIVGCIVGFFAGLLYQEYEASNYNFKAIEAARTSAANETKKVYEEQIAGLKAQIQQIDETKKTNEERIARITPQIQPKVTPIANTPIGQPPHRLTDVWQSGSLVWIFIVVDPHMSEADARSIVNTYDKKYRSALVLNIDIFGDATYAAHKFTEDTRISDKEYYAHVLYSYMRGGPGETKFWSPSGRYGQ